MTLAIEKQPKVKLSGAQKEALNILVQVGRMYHLPVHNLTVNGLLRKGYIVIDDDGRYSITALGRYVRA